MGGSGLYKNKNGRHPDEPLATLITNIMKNLLMQRYCSLRNVASVEMIISVKFTLSLQLFFLPLLRRMKNAMLDLHLEEKKRQNMFYNIRKNLNSASGDLWPRFRLGWWKTWWKTFLSDVWTSRILALLLQKNPETILSIAN